MAISDLSFARYALVINDEGRVCRIVPVKGEFSFKLLTFTDAVQVTISAYDYLILDLNGKLHSEVDYADLDGVENIVKVAEYEEKYFVIDRQHNVFTLELFTKEPENSDLEILTPVKNLSNIIDISSNDGHTLFLDTEGHVYYDIYVVESPTIIRSIDINPIDYRELEPTDLNIMENIIQISSGYIRSLLLDNNGDIFSVEISTETKIPYGRLIKTPYNIIQIASGYEQSLLLDNEGKVYSLTINNFGDLSWQDILSEIESNNYVRDNWEEIIFPTKIINIAVSGRNAILLDEVGEIYLHEISYTYNLPNNYSRLQGGSIVKIPNLNVHDKWNF